MDTKKIKAQIYIQQGMVTKGTGMMTNTWAMCVGRSRCTKAKQAKETKEINKFNKEVNQQNIYDLPQECKNRTTYIHKKE